MENTAEITTQVTKAAARRIRSEAAPVTVDTEWSENVVNPPKKKRFKANTKTVADEDPVIDLRVLLKVERVHLENPHFVMLGRDEEGKFNLAELWAEAKTVAVGAKTVAQILSETGVDLGAREFEITFSPNTGEVIAGAIIK